MAVGSTTGFRQHGRLAWRRKTVESFCDCSKNSCLGDEASMCLRRMVVDSIIIPGNMVVTFFLWTTKELRRVGRLRASDSKG
jgi:hypothetical protein